MEKLFTEIYEKLGISRDYAESCLNAGKVPAFSGQAGKRYSFDPKKKGVFVEPNPGETAFAYIQGMYFLTTPENEFAEPIPLQNLLVIPDEETEIDKILEWDAEREAFWVPAVQASSEYCPQMTHILVKPVNGGLAYIGG